MMHTLRNWFYRYFSDPEAVLLIVLLISAFALIGLMGHILAPLLASIVIAYILEWVVVRIQRLKIPRLAAVLFVYLVFLGLLFVALFVLVPLLWRQIISLFNDLPNMMLKGQEVVSSFVARFPDFLSQSQSDTFSNEVLTQARDWAKVVLSLSWSSITGLITVIVYFVLVPLVVFFLLKDRNLIIKWVTDFLPKKRGVLSKVSSEVNEQIGNYIRGKVFEIIVLGFAAYAVFWFFHLQYAVLLASLVGISALIPYVGAIVVTVPVVIVAYLQWGWGSEFGSLMIAYTIVHALDANILVPLLFSEAVNLHPVAIVAAILFFGGIWGFWGVFFAIPLATVVKALLNSWPQVHTQRR